jgi:hypothetical protein
MNNSLTGHVLSNPLVEVKENLAAGQAPISLNIALQARDRSRGIVCLLARAAGGLAVG